MSARKLTRFSLKQGVDIARRHVLKGAPVSDLCDERLRLTAFAVDSWPSSLAVVLLTTVCLARVDDG